MHYFSYVKLSFFFLKTNLLKFKPNLPTFNHITSGGRLILGDLISSEDKPFGNQL